MAKIAIYFWNCLTATSHTTKMAISQSKDFFKWYDSRIIYVVFKGGWEEFFLISLIKKQKLNDSFGIRSRSQNALLEMVRC